MTERDTIDVAERAQAFREMAEEYCPHGGLLYGDPCFDKVMEARENRQN